MAKNFLSRRANGKLFNENITEGVHPLSTLQRIGIIDIGSNSIRLVIYEQTGNLAHRIIDESKHSARLSQRIGQDGILPLKDIFAIIDTLSYFKKLCDIYRTARIRTVATAAIRNAANSQQIVQLLEEKTKLNIDVLSGTEEARLGFLGMTNTIDVEDGFLVDIGGGSTEITLFQNRKIINSISFPFGSVNTIVQHNKEGHINGSQVSAAQQMIENALLEQPWIRNHPGLPLIGLGGTFRSLSRIDQKSRKYSLPLTHNYVISGNDASHLLEKMQSMSINQLKKVEGLTKDRIDIIIPGMVILTTLFKHIQAEHFLISGSGIRDGIYYETLLPTQPFLENVLEHSVRNLLYLHPSVSVNHLHQVNRLVLKLYEDVFKPLLTEERSSIYLYVSSLLYRTGVTVNYYNFDKHTFYVMTHSRIDGLSHREILLCALIASYKSRNRTRQMALIHKDIISEPDIEIVVKLGTLLQLAIALDRSETQPILRLEAKALKKVCCLHLQLQHNPSVERREVEALSKDFHKVWGFHLKIMD
ncbi:MAG TPA: Ppx/GppA family phosphatase [Bacilli bacterium]